MCVSRIERAGARGGASECTYRHGALQTQNKQVKKSARVVYVCDESGAPPLVGCGNDPSAGSPTETLLRLQLPLEYKI